MTILVRRTAGLVNLALWLLTAIWWIGEPDAAIRMWNDVIRRIQALPVVRIRDHSHGAVVFPADYAAQQVLARNLTALKIERVAVAVVGRVAVLRDAPVVEDPAPLDVPRYVTPDEKPALS